MTKRTPAATAESIATQSVTKPDSRSDRTEQVKSSYAWVPVGGFAVTLLGVIGFAAGRAFVWTYWGEYGLASVFTLPLQDVVYFGFTANVAVFFQTLTVASVAFALLAILAYGSRAIREWIDDWQARRGKRSKAVTPKPWTKDDAGIFFSRALVVSLTLMIVVIGVSVVLKLASQEARQRADREREAFASWDRDEMAKLNLTLATATPVAPEVPQAAEPPAKRVKTCGFVVEGSDKLIALNDGRHTQLVPLDKDVRIRTWSLRLHEPEAREVATCECGLRTAPTMECATKPKS